MSLIVYVIMLPSVLPCGIFNPF